MILRNEKGQTLVATMITVGLIAILVLMSMRMVTFISRSVYRVENQEKTVALDIDLANLMVIPQLCTCNMLDHNIQFSTANLNQVFVVEELNFFDTPKTLLTQAACGGKGAAPLMATGQTHLPSGLTLGQIKIGPFHPLGDLATAESFLTTIRVENWDSTDEDMQNDVLKAKNKDSEFKMIVSTRRVNATQRQIIYCGLAAGNAAGTTTAAFGDTYYRYKQYSLNFGCNPAPPDMAVNPHPAQVEPYVMMRTQYFWPAEEGSMLTEYESTRVANRPVAPVSFSAFAGTAVCFEDVGVGDAAKLILPAHNIDECPAVKANFLNGGTVIDVGFSLVDNCRSRFF